MYDDERSTEPAESVPTPARAPELQALLHDLDALRLSLAADLSLAAAALEAGSPELAAAVVDADRDELTRFEQRALMQLAAAERPAHEPTELPAPRRRRRSLVAAVTPLLATAAAMLGVLGGLVPTGGTDAPGRAMTQTAMASYQELTQLTLEGAEATEVAAAAERLHAELAAIVAQASSDPAAAHEALALLESEALVLSRSADRDQLAGVIAEARTLVARLRAALPVPLRTPRLPAPTVAPDDVVAPTDVTLAPLPAPPSARPEPSPSAEPSEQAASPSPSPEPQPSETDGKPSGEPSPGSEHGLPNAVLPPD